MATIGSTDRSRLSVSNAKVQRDVAEPQKKHDLLDQHLLEQSELKCHGDQVEKKKKEI